MTTVGWKVGVFFALHVGSVSRAHHPFFCWDTVKMKNVELFFGV